MLVVPSLGISIVEFGCEEHPDRKARTAKASSDILDSLCVCFMIELLLYHLFLKNRPKIFSVASAEVDCGPSGSVVPNAT